MERRWEKELEDFDAVWARVRASKEREAPKPEPRERDARCCARRCGVKLMPRRRGKRYE